MADDSEVDGDEHVSRYKSPGRTDNFRLAGDTVKLAIAARRELRQFFGESEMLGRKGIRAELKHMRISSIASSTITEIKGGTKTNSSFSPLEALNLISQ